MLRHGNTSYIWGCFFIFKCISYHTWHTEKVDFKILWHPCWALGWQDRAVHFDINTISLSKTTFVHSVNGRTMSTVCPVVIFTHIWWRSAIVGRHKQHQWPRWTMTFKYLRITHYIMNGIFSWNINLTIIFTLLYFIILFCNMYINILSGINCLLPLLKQEAKH